MGFFLFFFRKTVQKTMSGAEMLTKVKVSGVSLSLTPGGNSVNLILWILLGLNGFFFLSNKDKTNKLFVKENREVFEQT